MIYVVNQRFMRALTGNSSALAGKFCPPHLPFAPLARTLDGE